MLKFINVFQATCKVRNLSMTGQQQQQHQQHQQQHHTRSMRVADSRAFGRSTAQQLDISLTHRGRTKVKAESSDFCQCGN